MATRNFRVGALYKRVSLFGRNTVSPSRPYASDRAARSGGQDWPKATAAGGCLDGREHGASLHEAGPCTERLATGDGTDNLLGQLARHKQRTSDRSLRGLCRHTVAKGVSLSARTG